MKKHNTVLLKKIFATLTILLSVKMIYAQAPAKWSVAGNTAVSGDFLGTTNNEDLVFKTNNTAVFKIKSNGNFILKSLEGFGNGLLTIDNNGKLIHKAFTGDANQVLLGDGTFGALPSGLWSTGAGSKIFYNGGKVGIGTATPNFKLDVDGDVRITQNLYLQGALVISDKIQTPKQMKAGSIVVDSLLMDSTKAIYGTTNFVNDVKLQSKLSVYGNTTINGTATVNGDMKTMGSFTFAGDKTIRYDPASPGRSPSISFGIDVPLPPDPCVTLTPMTMDIPGLFQSVGFAAVGGQLNRMLMGFDGANSIIEVAGTNSSGVAPRLLINYNCGKDVYVCTGANGGNINLSGGANGGNVNICSGATGNVVLANSVGPRIGVATDNPLAKFDIQNNDPSIPTMAITKVDPSRLRRLIFEPKLNGGDYNYLTQPEDMGIIWSDGSTPTGASSGFVLCAHGGAGTAYPFPGLRMTKQGFIGIGTPFPEAMVDIQNGEYVGGPGVRNPIGLKVTSTYTNNPSLGVGILCEVGNDNSKTFSSGKTDGTTYNENFVVFGDGHVFARDIRVTLDAPFPHPDYVFEKNYKLRSIEQVEQFIRLNGHLPEVVSAFDVEKNNGINLGEMSEVQLKKIEELTLYIIELNKKLTELATTVQVQQSEIQTLKNK